MRTLTGTTLTENAKLLGSRPIHVLRISTIESDFTLSGPAGDLFYSSDDHVIPHAADSTTYTTVGRISKFTPFTESAQPEQVGGFSENVIEIVDSDLALHALVNGSPAGLADRVAELSLIYKVDTPDVLVPGVVPVAGDWDDRLILFRGVLDSPEWNSLDRTWRFRFKDPSALFAGEIGFRVDAQDFVDLNCEPDEGSILPITCGRALRAPCLLIDHPGRDVLINQFNVFDSTLQISRDHSDAGFDTTGTIVVATSAQNYETFTGSWVGDTFTWTTRSDILRSGVIDGVVTSGGHRFLAVPTSDVTGLSLGGYLVSVEQTFGAGDWVTLVIDQFSDFGGSTSLAFEGDLSFTSGLRYRIWRWPGLVRFWPAGSLVMGVGDWVYCANFIPSSAVNSVNTFEKFNPPGGGETDPAWYEILPANYTVDLDNRAYNTQLGRTALQVGMTTITFSDAPGALGFDYRRVLADMDGPLNDFGAVAEYAPDIIKLLAEHKVPGLGQIPDEMIDGTAINSTLTTVQTSRPIKIAFTLTESRPGMEFLGQLAFEGGCHLSWTSGTLNVLFWPDITGTPTAGDVTEASSEDWPDKTFRRRSEIFTQFMAEWRPYPTSRPYRYFRESSDGITAFGRNEREFKFEFIQRPTSVALSLNHWGSWFLNYQADVAIRRLMPDHISRQIVDLAAAVYTQFDSDLNPTIVMNESGVILSQTIPLFQLSTGSGGMLTDLSIAINEWLFTLVAVSAPSDDLCDPSAPLPGLDPSFGVADSQQGFPLPS